jgi:hypothetical protein
MVFMLVFSGDMGLLPARAGLSPAFGGALNHLNLG